MNHHLFFADLAIRQDDFGSILPEYSAVVFDEAHEIEDVASDYFGRRVSSYRFEELVRDTEAMLRLLKIEGAPLRKHLMRVSERARTFFEHFPEREGRFPFGPAERKSFLEQNHEAFRRSVRRSETHRDGAFRAQSQAGRSRDAREAGGGSAARIRIFAGERRKKLRLLVRTARHCRPIIVQDAHGRSPGIHHRFNGKNHAFFQQRTVAGAGQSWESAVPRASPCQFRDPQTPSPPSTRFSRHTAAR